jgi:hypothetical protein
MTNISSEICVNNDETGKQLFMVMLNTLKGQYSHPCNATCLNTFVLLVQPNLHKKYILFFKGSFPFRVKTFLTFSVLHQQQHLLPSVTQFLLLSVLLLVHKCNGIFLNASHNLLNTPAHPLIAQTFISY